MQPETQYFTIDGHSIPLVINKSTRSRRLSIRILEKESAIKLTIPAFCSTKKALAFLNERSVWVANHLHLLQSKVALVDDVTVPIFGESHLITHTPEAKAGVLRHEKQLLVSGLKENIPLRVQRFLKKEMQLYCNEQAKTYADALNLSHKLQRVTIRETSSRWGSCSSSGAISLCWRLVFAPKEVLDYVILHEVCHLSEMNHSPRFWKKVSSVTPNYATFKKWLISNGYKLWKYQS